MLCGKGGLKRVKPGKAAQATDIECLATPIDAKALTHEGHSQTANPRPLTCSQSCIEDMKQAAMLLFSFEDLAWP